VPQIKTSPDHPASMAERVNKRLRNSGEGANPDVTVTRGSSPNRTHTNLHHSANLTPSNAQHERGQDDWSKERK
jgi:hypothetical protein